MSKRLGETKADVRLLRKMRKPVLVEMTGTELGEILAALRMCELDALADLMHTRFTVACDKPRVRPTDSD